MSKIRLGVIGCGHWGPNFLRNFSVLPTVELAAICELNPEKLKQMKKLYPAAAIYKDYQKLFKEANVQAVIISTPAATHYPIGRDALKAGLHLLVEKPIGVTVKEADTLEALARKAGKVLLVGHTFLYNPAVRKMKEIVSQGELGRIYYAHARRTNLGPIRKDVNAIWDLSCHDISILNYLFGSLPVFVSAFAQRFLSHKLEDVGFIILKYPHDILCHIHVSWLDPKKVREMTLIGDKRMLVYEDTNQNEPLRLYDKNVMRKKYEKVYRTFEEFQLIINDGQVTFPKVNMQEPLSIECRHFIECIENNSPPLTDAPGGRDIVKVLVAIDKSVQQKGAFVKI